jgi:hypothetical protein
MVLAREWDELVEQVRKLEGFANFLRPPPLDTLLGAAARGPVVVVNVSRWRCDALIVTTDGVRVVELPDLTPDEVERRTIEYLRLLQEDAQVDPGLPFTVAVRQRATKLQERERTLRSTMEWLWEVVADPVLAALGITQPHIPGEPWYRLWWCPTGLLTLLPLHGAGYHSAADGRTVLDRVVSSYTPTLRVLREAMEVSAERAAAGSDRLLFVGVPDAPDQLQLAEEVAGEREFLRERFPSDLTVIEGGDATMSTVQAAMAQHRWIHLSCHGHQDLNDPSTAGFVLSNGTFSITRISAMHYTGEYAFLSACKTATGGLNLPDEVITLAAALNYTGYRHVLATLWSVDPTVAMEVTEAVYPRLINDGVFDPDKSALALHHAVRMLRAGGRPLDDWLPFTHNGP